ncbi:MAG: maleylpyruvate isomerase N-terminal domain-containing protein [Pseudomonadota bacterium]
MRGSPRGWRRRCPCPDWTRHHPLRRHIWSWQEAVAGKSNDTEKTGGSVQVQAAGRPAAARSSANRASRRSRQAWISCIRSRAETGSAW